MRSVKNVLYKLIAEKKIAPKDAMEVFKELDGSARYLDDDIAVIGMSGRLPKAQNLNEYWENLKKAENCISKVSDARRKDIELLLTKEQKDNAEYRPAGFMEDIDKFDAAFFRISPKEAKYMEPEQRIFMEVAWEAIEDAGYPDLIQGTKTGVFIGHDHVSGSVYSRYTGGIQSPDTLALTGTYPSILSSRISYLLDLKGPSIIYDTACSSGLVAIHQACQALRNMECDMVIAGGVNLQLWPVKLNSFKMVETENEIVRTFDKNSSGTVWGEGVCVFLLKPLSKALSDCDNIHAVIKGSAINNDGVSSGITAPNAQAQEDVIVRAWKEAKIDAETISYIEAHGTGTVMGDPIEIKALRNAFSRFTEKKQFCGIGSLKPSIGHLVSASGTASLLKVILAMKHKEIPATINFKEPNPYIDFSESQIYINDKLRKWEQEGHPRRAGISCFGFSGTNCHMVVEEAPEKTAGLPIENTEQPNILLLSAKSQNALESLIDRYREHLGRVPGLSLTEICHTACTGRRHYEYRAAFIVNSVPMLKEKLDMAAVSLHNAIKEKSIFFGIHRLVTKHGNEKLEGEITQSEKQQLNIEANKMIKEMLSNGENTEAVMEAVGQFYVQGADLNWSEHIYNGKKIRRISLPQYPFEKTRYWYTPEAIEYEQQGADSLFETVWVEKSLEGHVIKPDSGSVLIFEDDGCLCRNIAGEFYKKGRNVIRVSFGSEYKRIDSNRFVISGNEKDYTALLSEIKKDKISCIVHLSSIRADNGKDDLSRLEENQKRGLFSLFYLVKGLAANLYTEEIDLVLVSDYAYQVDGTEYRICPHNTAFLGMGKVVGLEYDNLKCRSIDTDDDIQVQMIMNELSAQDNQTVVAYREGKRYIEELSSLKVVDTADAIPGFKENGAYIITGGMGGIGLEMCRYLAGKSRVNICLIGRTRMPEQEKWDEIIAEGTDTKLCSRISTLKSIECTGSKVFVYSADVSEGSQLQQVIDAIRTRFGRINGVFHCAGVSGDFAKRVFTDGKNEDTLRSVTAPKIKGTLLLDQLTEKDKPDIFVLFSSIITLMGAQGQSDYCAANSYLDSYCAYRNKKGLKTVSVNWTGWKEVGMAAEQGLAKSSGMFKTISNKDAAAYMDLILKSGVTRAVVGEFDYEALRYIKDQLRINFSTGIIENMEKEILKITSRGKTGSKKKSLNVSIVGKTSGKPTETEIKIGKLWGEILETQEINIHMTFYDMGGDSILATQLVKEIQKEYPGMVTVHDIFLYPTVEELSGFISEKTNKARMDAINETVSDKKLKDMLDCLESGTGSEEGILGLLEGLRKGES